MRKLKLVAKRLLFPGLDLHTRCRYRFLPQFFRAGNYATLDAGCGNGALTCAAYHKGNHILAVTLSEREVRDTSAFFGYMGIPNDRVEFRLMNVYDLDRLGRKFDQIICSETLEHMKRDAEVVRMFSGLLSPGGELILCCPHALHPEHALGRTDEPETGDHVRDGYTAAGYRALLEPAGFNVCQQVGLGSPLLVWLDRVLRVVRHRAGDLAAFPLFLLMLPLTRLDYTNPRMPFSLVVVAEKSS